jgi:hypothetical protein
MRTMGNGTPIAQRRMVQFTAARRDQRVGVWGRDSGNGICGMTASKRVVQTGKTRLARPAFADDEEQAESFIFSRKTWGSGGYLGDGTWL